MPAAHAVAPEVEKPEKSLQLSQKITQFRLNRVYQFTQHLRIVKHLLIRADIIFRNSSATKALSHKGYNIFLLMPFLIRGTLKLIENQDAYRLALNGQVFVLSTPVASRLQL